MNNTQTPEDTQYLTTGRAFMYIMTDFYRRSDCPDFDTEVELDDLYITLSNLYHKSKNQ